MTRKNLNFAIYLSSIMLIAGVFLPLTKLPFYGDVSYHRIAGFESYLIILFAAAAPVLLFMNQHRLVKLAPAGVWLTLLLPMIKGLFKSDDTSLFGKISSRAASAMQDFAADFFMNIADFRWGGLVFLAGLLIFTVSCLLWSLQAQSESA